jgi:hypothetical protein
MVMLVMVLGVMTRVVGVLLVEVVAVVMKMVVLDVVVGVTRPAELVIGEVAEVWSCTDPGVGGEEARRPQQRERDKGRR